MSRFAVGRPAPAEYHAYFGRYIDRVPEDDVVAALEAQHGLLTRTLGALGEEQAAFRYADGKWSIREVVGHLTDTERIMVYRALAFARGETGPLPGFDENAYVRGAAFDAVPLGQLLAEFEAVRIATLYFARHLTAEAWVRAGTANGKTMSVRALLYVVAGHLPHHLGVLYERYGVTEAK